MPSLTREEAQALGRRADRPQIAPGELLAVSVSGKLVNLANKKWGWRGVMGYRTRWKDAVAMALLETGYLPARGAKVVTFQARTARTMDTDGLQASLKPVRDALVECGVISGDAPTDGHEFVYEQTVDRARRGVTIRVRRKSHDPSGAR